MITIDPQIAKRYQLMLEERKVLPARHIDYKKWLRYYLDYCHKYNLSNTSSKNITQFLKKLREKKQTDAQIKQASHAVSLYLDLAKRPHTASINQQASGKTADKKSLVTPLDTTLEWDRAVGDLAAIIKTRHYSRKTLSSYRHWIQKFRGFIKDQGPSSLTTDDVKAYLTRLAVRCNVSASSQNQAFNAVLFFFRHVLKKEFGQLKDVVRAKRTRYIPVVLSRDEVQTVIKNLHCFAVAYF